MEIYLVRHGEAAAKWGQADDPGLSTLGQQQAKRACASLLSQLNNKTNLISSPLRRARETASPLETALAKNVELDDAYREIPAPVALPDRQNWLQGFMQQRWDEQPDSILRWRSQLVHGLVELQGQTVVFTHFMVLNAVVGQLTARRETVCFWPDNGSITQLRHTGTGLELVELGAQIKTFVN